MKGYPPSRFVFLHAILSPKTKLGEGTYDEESHYDNVRREKPMRAGIMRNDLLHHVARISS